MSVHGWQALVIVAVVFVALLRNWWPPDLVLVAGTVVCALIGLISADEAFRGFSNEGLLTVAALFVVARGMQNSGVLDLVGSRMFGGARTSRQALVRLALWVPALSSMMNNTPIVAMLLPVVSTWCRRNRVAPSRLLMPLSFFTILGGMITLVGTSTNLVVSSLLADTKLRLTDPAFAAQLRPFGLLEIAPLGIICSVIGVLYLLWGAERLIPDRGDLLEQFGDSSREYLVNMLVQPGCPLEGRSVADAGLRNLPGLFLIEISRADTHLSPVEPDERIRIGDRLTFTGVIGSIVDLEKIPRFVPAPDEEDGVRPRRWRRLSEAVVSPVSPLVGRTIRDSDFRALYNAVVVAVHRGGSRLRGRVGDTVLKSGDTLLLQTGPHFARAYRNHPDFVLVSTLDDFPPVRHDRAPLALALLALLLTLMVTEWIPVSLAAFAVALLLVATRCLAPAEATEGVDWQTLIGIGAGFGLGTALHHSGAANVIAGSLVRAVGPMGPHAILAAVYLLTLVTTEVLSNNAAAALMLPLAVATASNAGLSPRPFAVAIMFAASLAFATPIGYQTNLMVYGPGGYKFTDFTRVGLPLNLITMLLAVTLIPMIWPLALVR